MSSSSFGHDRKVRDQLPVCFCLIGEHLPACLLISEATDVSSKKTAKCDAGFRFSVLRTDRILCSVFLTRPIGKWPAGPAVFSPAFQIPWADRPVQLIGLGDGITAGLGAKSPAHTFFNCMIMNPVDEFAEMKGSCLSSVLPQLSYENFSISVSTWREHLALIEDRFPTFDADKFGLIVMTSGGNDLIHSYGRMPPKECAMYGATETGAMPWIAAFRERLELMLSKIEAAFPGGCEI